MGLQLRRGRTLVKRCMLGLIFVAGLAGCSGQQPALNDAATANDPFESHNRHTFALNQAIDTYAFEAFIARIQCRNTIRFSVNCEK